MDAHDIFRKLTKGVYFSKKRLPEKFQVKEDTSQKPTTVLTKNEDHIKRIKREPDSDTEFQLLSDSVQIKAVGKKRKEVNPEIKLKKLKEEELNHYRNINKINAVGKKIPPPIRTFEELQTTYKVPSKLLDNLAKCGYPLPTPIQMQAVPIMLQERPLLACAPTGSGKTVAFLIPIIRDLGGPQKKGFRAIILCPTRELAKQTLRECVRLTENIGLKTHVISKISQVEQKFGPKSNKKYDILVSTPNRIRYILSQEQPLLDLKSIEWIIIDEADKLMEEGQNSFKEQLDDILLACSNPKRKIALFSATYTVPVAKWALKNLKHLVRVTIGEQNTATDLVQQELLFVGSESGKLLAFRDLVRGGLQPPVLVFVQSKERAKQLFDELIYDGINVDVIHADRTQKQRDNVVKAFREGKIWVLICTELMGRGIDFKGVNLVVNYDFPPSKISYIHRIGRTGRAGRPGKAITYYTQDDTVNLRSIAHVIKNSGGNVPDFMLTLKKPKKSEKKKLANKAPERDDITTIPKFILEKRKKLKEERLLKLSGAKMLDKSEEKQTKEKILKEFKKKRFESEKVTKKKNYVLVNKSD